MPKFTITNTGPRRLQVRDSKRGLRPLLPLASEEFDMPASLARYYKSAGATVDPDPDSAEGRKGGGEAGGGKKSLADLTGADRQKIVDAEHIDLGDVDIESDDAVALIGEFRRIYESGTDQMLRDTYKDVDFAEAKAKYDVVNAIIAAKGVSA